MKKILLLLLISLSFASVVDFTSSVQHSKIVNSDAGLEILAKASMRLTELIDLPRTDILYGTYFGLGFSQQYTAPRASQFAYNHYGDRIDWSIGGVFGDIEAIYTHSMRNKYSGASPDVLFFNKDVDSFKIRFNKKFNF